MSPEKKRDFESEWPYLARRLRSFLTRKRVPAAQHDDLIQETALRLYKMWDSVDRSRPAWALTVTIVLNLLRDEYRRTPHSDIVSELPDMAHSYDVERAGIARVELGRVRAALAELSPAHRLVLLAEVGQGDGAIADAGDKMRRMRARRKLTEILERVSAIFVLTAKRVGDTFHAIVGLREGLFAGVSCALCTVLGLGVVVSVPVTAQRAQASTLEESASGETAAITARSILSAARRSTAAVGSTDLPPAFATVRARSSRAAVTKAQTEPADGSPLPEIPLPTGDQPPTVPLPGREPSGDNPVPVPAPPPLPLPTQGDQAPDAGRLVESLESSLTK